MAMERKLNGTRKALTMSAFDVLGHAGKVMARK